MTADRLQYREEVGYSLANTGAGLDQQRPSLRQRAAHRLRHVCLFMAGLKLIAIERTKSSLVLQPSGQRGRFTRQ